MTDRPGRIKSLLLAAGLGTRLRPLTDSVPKCLIPIAGRPLLDIWIQRLLECGIREARINTHALATAVRPILRRSMPKTGCFWSRRTSQYSLGSSGTVTANADLADDVDEIVDYLRGQLQRHRPAAFDRIPSTTHRSADDGSVSALTPALVVLPSWTRKDESSPSSRSRKHQPATSLMQGSTSLMLLPIGKSPR